MVIFRLAPGEVAPWDGTYELVGEYGEHTGRLITLRNGERLPLVGAADDSELWFILLDEPTAVTDAA